jgi:hypothetical protein
VGVPPHNARVEFCSEGQASASLILRFHQCGVASRSTRRVIMLKHPHPGPPPQAGEGEDIPPPSRGALRPSCACRFALQEKGAGNAGCWLAPAVSCAICTDKCAHEHTGTAGAARHSLRDGLTAYTELSLETNSFCLHRRRIEDPAKPGWARNISAGLTPATGARTTRLCRPLFTPFVGARSSLMSKLTLRRRVARPACRGHRSPHPTSVTIAIRPSCGRGMAGVVGVIWGKREAEYF